MPAQLNHCLELQFCNSADALFEVAFFPEKSGVQQAPMVRSGLIGVKLFAPGFDHIRGSFERIEQVK